MGSMGMIDYYRLPLACWYWYREHLAGKSAPKPKKEGTPFQICLSSDVNRFRANGQEDAWICAELLDQEGNPISNEIELTFTVEKGDGISQLERRSRSHQKRKHVGWTCCNRISKLVWR